MVELHCGAATDIGLVRETNQDACLASAPVFVVADGMGGHQGGGTTPTAVVADVVGLTETEQPQEMRTAPVSLEEKLGALP